MSNNPSNCSLYSTASVVHLDILQAFTEMGWAVTGLHGEEGQTFRQVFIQTTSVYVACIALLLMFSLPEWNEMNNNWLLPLNVL